MIIEGISNEVLVLTTSFFLSIGILFLFSKVYRRSILIHASYIDQVQAIRERVLAARDSPQTLHRAQDTRCPICIDVLNFAVETNCGHVFCCGCIMAYWEHGLWTEAMNCPVCRQQVRVLLPDFTHDEEVSQGLGVHVTKVQQYNRRFSGEPRPILDYVYDFPVLLRHMLRNLFTVNGFVSMLRYRIILYLGVAVVYTLSPYDIIPEFVFGALGFLDDLVLVACLLFYLTVLYRRSLAA